MRQSPLVWLLFSLALIVIITFVSPEEKTLGANVCIVYLHGAWVLAAEIAFFAAALGGLAGLIIRRSVFHRWSAALGRAGIIFWVTYLPLSLWAMQTNWNGLFLSEPRFRLVSIFAITGVLLQGGLAIINQPVLTSAANVAFIVVLRLAFSQAVYVMHPLSTFARAL